MHLFAPVIVAILFLAFPNTVLGVNRHGHRLASRHIAPQSLDTFDLHKNASSVSDLEKRFDGARFSFYKAGLGACGKVNGDNDFIVALNHGQFDSGDFCFKTITITCRGKTTNAQIVDRCVECPYGALDFSRGLFNFFGYEDLGYIYGSWNLAGAEPPKPTPKPTPKPSPTKEKPTTTSSKPEEPKTTSTKKTTASSTTVASSTTSTSSSIIPSATPLVIPTDAMPKLDMFMVQLGRFMIATAK